MSASGLNLVTAAIVRWNTVYLERAVQAVHARSVPADTAPLLPYLSPLGWKHINLTGDYVWQQNRRLQSVRFRPLRPTADYSPGPDTSHSSHIWRLFPIGDERTRLSVEKCAFL